VRPRARRQKRCYCPRVNKYLVVVALLCACSKSQDKESAPPPATGSAVAGSAAAPPPTPYTPSADTSEPIKAAIAAADRSDKDRSIDVGRKPGEVFTFFKIAPGQKIGELFSGPGYSTELLARIVGDSGKVYAQNTKDIMDRFAREPLTARLAKPVMKNTVMVEQPAETPFPPEAKGLDAVVCILNYHDYVWQKVDRAKLNKAVFDALKPGGIYAIVDHSGPAGSGVRDVETNHRIDEEVVKQEITAAGFKLDGESGVLRNPDDKRDWNDSPKAAGDKRGTSDRFVLRFVKP
jgi:predicted methyltransferase